MTLCDFLFFLRIGLSRSYVIFSLRLSLAIVPAVTSATCGASSRSALFTRMSSGLRRKLPCCTYRGFVAEPPHEMSEHRDS